MDVSTEVVITIESTSSTFRSSVGTEERESKGCRLGSHVNYLKWKFYLGLRLW